MPFAGILEKVFFSFLTGIAVGKTAQKIIKIIFRSIRHRKDMRTARTHWRAAKQKR